MSPSSAQPMPANEMPYSEAEYEALIEQLITEDDEPVDNILSAKQQRLLTETLYNSWDGAGHKFLAEANIGLFHVMRNPAIVPDMLLSLDVEVRQDWWDKTQRSYFIWEFGKPPEVVVEIVSNTIGGEQTEKKRKYALMRVLYYLVFDPQRLLSTETLSIYRLDGLSYRRQDSLYLTEVKLGVALWEGVYEDVAGTWLRWTDEQEALLPCGKELIDQERAEKETALAEKHAAQARAERLAEQLRTLGIEPE
jgi:Uma2 family endonuclease